MTLIFCEAEEDQVQNIKATLICVEAVSGLKINFFKSELIGIGVDSYRPVFANILGFKIGSFPIIYLGLPLCLGRTKKLVWNPVLKGWRKRSICGELIICP